MRTIRLIFLAALAVALGLCAQALAQNSVHQNVALTPTGTPARFAKVLVCHFPANAVPCTNLATLYADPTTSNSVPNPLTTDQFGNYNFWAPQGFYSFQIEQNGQPAVYKSYVDILPNDPLNPIFNSVTLTQECTASNQACTKNYIDTHGGGANLPHVQLMLSGDGAGGAQGMPEKGTNPVADQAFVAWDEDQELGRKDCRNAKYGPGGCLGANAAQAMQDLSDDMTCWQIANPGKHASTLLPAGIIRVGTPAHPTLIFPSGAYIRGTGGEGSASALTGSALLGIYNNVTHFKVELDHVVTCNGTPQTNTLLGGSYERFTVTGCDVGGCTNVPGDSGDYPEGGPLDVAISITDAGYWIDQLVSQNTGGDGIIFDGEDARLGQAFAYSHDFFFYFGMDVAGQNYQFADGEFHGGIYLKVLDGVFFGPFETYGTGNQLGWEYGRVCGVVWGGGLTHLGPVTAQVEEIGECRIGTGPGAQMGGRFDGALGPGLVALSGADVFTSPRVVSACRYDGANKYVINTVTVATPGSGQTPGTYRLTASSGVGQILVTVGGGGTVTATPIVAVHGRNYTSTPPTFTLSAGGTPATFTVAMETAWQVPGFMINNGVHIQENKCDPYMDIPSSFGIDTYIAPQIADFADVFGPGHTTGDIYPPKPTNWIFPLGSVPSAHSNGQAVNWDWGTAQFSGQGQRISLPDVSLQHSANGVTGSVIDLDVTGGTFEMGNSTPTTITMIKHGWLQQDLYVTGDGFTTIPAALTYDDNTATGAVVGCTPGQPVLLKRSHLYHFKAEGQDIFGIPPILGEVGCDVNVNFQQVGFGALTSLPPIDDIAASHVAGSIATTIYPALPQGTLTSAGSTTAFTYCFIREVRGPGTQTDGLVCSAKPPVVATSMDNLFYHGNIPLNWLEYKVVFQSTTDAAFTALLGTILDVQSPDGTPQPAIADVNFPIQPVSLSGDAYNIPTASQHLNITGIYRYDLTITPPTVSAVFCNKGDLIPNNPAAPTGFDYLCNAQNHWVERAVNPWNSF